MYIFVTYADPGMKGVQVRGIRIAQYLPKNKVFFINSGDDSWLKKYKIRYKNIPDRIYLPGQIPLPKNTKKIIFADLPTNKSFQISLLLQANRMRIPCIVVDNIYRKNQLRETIWKNIKQVTDLFLLNGLSYLNFKADPKVKIIPPLIPSPSNVLKRKIFSKYKIPFDHKIIIASAYESSVLRDLSELIKKISKKNKKIIFVIFGLRKKIKVPSKTILLPPLSGQEISTWLSISDLFIGKFGYLQVIEALVLRKPVISVGVKEGFKPKWIDKKLFKVIVRHPKIDDDLIKKIFDLIYNEKVKKRLQENIAKLHDGQLDGDLIAAKLIKGVKYSSKKIPKNVILSLDDEVSIDKLREITKKEIFILPIILAIPLYSKAKKNWWLKDSRRVKEGGKTIIDTNFRLVYQFSYHGLHSSGPIFGWYNNLFSDLKRILQESDKILVVGFKLKLILRSLINKKTYNKIKVV